MAALDTNVLVRWLTNDDVEQCAKVAALFQRTEQAGEQLYVPVTVILELEWVLRSRYKFGREAIASALDSLLSVSHLSIMTEAAVEQALWLFKQEGAPDFADCLHVSMASQAGQSPLLTFDAKASQVAGATPLA